MSAAALGTRSAARYGLGIAARARQPEDVAVHLLVRSHAGDEGVRDRGVEADLVERVDVLLERLHPQRLDVVADLAEREAAAVDIELVAEEMAARADHAEELRHDLVVRPDQRVVHRLGVLPEHPLDAGDADAEVLELVVEDVQRHLRRRRVGIFLFAERPIEHDRHRLGHQVLDDQARGEIALSDGSGEVLPDVVPLRLDAPPLHAEVEADAELGEEEDVLALLLRLVRGLDLLLDARHELNHLGVILDRHDLAGDGVGDDVREQVVVAAVALRRADRFGNGRDVFHGELPSNYALPALPERKSRRQSPRPTAARPGTSYEVMLAMSWLTTSRSKPAW